MTNAIIMSTEGKKIQEVTIPTVFNHEYKLWIINRAIIAENTWNLQPQGHYLLAGMQTTAAYIGRYGTWRTGRHVGRAINPREKLASGAQGKVRRVPSAVTGKRAAPHLIEKRIKEKINKKEYTIALYSAMAKTFKNLPEPIILENKAESIKNTKEVNKLLKELKIISNKKSNPSTKKTNRSAKQKKYKHIVTIVVKEDKGIVKAARNIPGVNVCVLDKITVGKLMPGGYPKCISIWSEDAVKDADTIKLKIKLK